VGLTAPYGHNGYFQTLKEIVHFYNTRDVPGAGWPEPEVAANVDTMNMGDLGLTDAEEDAIVAFLEALSDGWDASSAVEAGPEDRTTEGRAGTAKAGRRLSIGRGMLSRRICGGSRSARVDERVMSVCRLCRLPSPQA